MIGANAEAIARRARIASFSRRRWIKIGLDMAALRHRPHPGGGTRRSPAKIGTVPAHHPPRLHAWAGTGGGIGLQSSEEFEEHRKARAGSLARHGGANRGVAPRLEGIRDGGHARHARTTACIICSIENFDPMGVHTGDSITVAPAQTLTDKRIPDHARRLVRRHSRDRR